MKINVTLQIELSAEQAKRLTYEDGQPIRDIVRERVLNDVQQVAWIDEADATVTLK